MVDETCYDELDLIDIILMLKKYWKMITSLTILTMLIIGSVTAFFIQPKYTSQVVFEVCNLPESEREISFLIKRINTADFHLGLIRTNLFLEKILTQTGMEVDPGITSLLSRSVELQKKQDLVFLLKVTWTDPETAYKLVQSIFESHLTNITKPLLEQNRVKQNFLLAQLEKKRAELAEVENQLARIEKENGITVLANQVLVDDAYQYRRRQDLAEC